MQLPDQSVTLTPAEISELSDHLASLRHNVNNCVSLIIATAELLQRKPDLAARFVSSLAEQPSRITEEVKGFSDKLEKALRITRP